MENVIILGTGCAGFTAGIYTARAEFKSPYPRRQAARRTAHHHI